MFLIHQEKETSGIAEWKLFYKHFVRIYLTKVGWFVNVSRQQAGSPLILFLFSRFFLKVNFPK
jgi:hypothetical protein